ncbi:MAG: hypothetical protein AB8G05_18815 [Oligoflexales bacterium]
MKLNAKHLLMSFVRAGSNLREFTTLLIVAGFMTSCGLITQKPNYSGQAEFMDNPPGVSSGEYASRSDATAGSADDFVMDEILDKLNSDIVAIQQQIVALQEADEAINSRIDVLEAELNKFKEDMAKAIQELKDKDKELQEALIAMEERFNARITAEVQLLNAEIADLKTEDAAIRTAMEQLEKDLTDYTDGKISDLDMKLSDALEAVRKSLEDKINAEVAALQKQITDNHNELLAEISRLDLAMEDINSSLDTLAAEIAANGDADWASRKSIAATILEGYAQEADTIALSRDDAGITAAQTRLNDFDHTTNPDPMTEFQGIMTDITAVKVAVMDAVEAYKAAQEAALATTVAGIQAQINAAVQAHEDRVAEVDGKFVVVNNKIAGMQAQINAINSQLNQLAVIAQRLDALENHTTSLQIAVDTINDNFTPEVLEQIASNKNAIKMNQTAINTLTLSINAINTTIAKIQEDVLGLKVGQSEVDMLTGVLGSYKDDTGAIFAEYMNKLASDAGLEIGARIEWITEISVRYQATSTHYQKGIAELIALFRSKEMQNGDIADAITAVESDFTSYMSADLSNKENIRAKMQEYTDELSKMRADLDNLQDAHDALAKDAVKRDEFDKEIQALKAKDAELASQIEQALADAKAYTDQAINTYKIEVSAMFDGMGEEIQQTAAALASDVADLKVKNKALSEKHAVLEGRVDGMVLSQERMAELEEKRTKAEAAYDLFLRALFELERKIVNVWDPAQGEANWADYLADFKAKVMDPRAVNPELCGIEFGASFPNSIGLDAQRILAMEVVNKVWQGHDSTGNLQLIAGQTTMLNRYPAGVAKDSSCLVQAMTWAEGANLQGFHTKKGGDVSLTDALDGDDEYLTLKARFVNTIQAYAADWQAYQDILAEIHEAHGDALAALLADVALSLQDQLATKAELEAVRSQLQTQIDSMQQSIGGLEAKDAAFENELAGIKDQVSGMEEDYKAADANLQAQIDAIPDPETPAGVSEGMADLIAIVAEIAKRSGYADLALDAEQIGTNLFADVFDANKFRFEPKFTECQHFFSDLYQDLADGQLKDENGNVVTNISNHWRSHTTGLMNQGDRSLCDSSSIGFGEGAAQNRWNSHNGHCWVNFRNRTLNQYHKTAVANVMYRCMGSAQLAVGRSNNGNKVIVPFNPADPINVVAQAAQKIDGYASADVVSHEKVAVHGSHFAGVFDFYPTQLLLKPNSVRSTSYYDLDTYLTPVAFDIAGEGNYSFRLGAEVRHRVELYSPIVLDFISKSDKVRTLQHAKGVNFDLDANGSAERTGWVDGLDGAFLALDLNKNGKIDDGSELFGQSTILKNGQKAKHGYEALAHYDANQDGKIDAKDPVFNDLVVWFDKNVDGVSQKHELYSLQDKDVSALSVGYTELAGNSGFDKGNLVKYKAKFFGPASCPETGCNSYDVFFGASVELSSK